MCIKQRRSICLAGGKNISVDSKREPTEILKRNFHGCRKSGFKRNLLAGCHADPSRLTRNNCREKFIQGIITDAMRIAAAISDFVLCQVIRQGLRVALALFCRSLALTTWRMYCQAGSVSKTTTKNIPAKPQVIVYCNRVFRRRTKIEACHTFAVSPRRLGSAFGYSLFY